MLDSSSYDFTCSAKQPILPTSHDRDLRWSFERYSGGGNGRGLNGRDGGPLTAGEHVSVAQFLLLLGGIGWKSI